MTDTDFDNLLAALLLLGVHEGYALQRHALATELHAAGWTYDDVELIADWCRRNHPRAKLAPKLAGVLSSPQERAERLEDIRAVQEAQARSQAASGAQTRFQDDPPNLTPEEEQWREDDRAVAVSTRVDVDLQHVDETEALERVVDEFQIPASLAAHLLARGRELRRCRAISPRAGVGSLKDDEPVETPSERLARFQEFLRTGKREAAS